MAVVESLKNISVCVIKCNLLVVTCGHDVLSKPEGVRDGMMGEYFFERLILHRVGEDASVS